MSEEKKVPLYTLQQAHFYFATSCYNQCMQLLHNEHRTPEENEMLRHLAHTSLYHWHQCGSLSNHQQGEWLLARVYISIESKTEALHHAMRCLEMTRDNDLKDSYLAFAYESVARAYALSGDKQQCDKYYQLAEEAGTIIPEEEDKRVFFENLRGGKWYGLA